MPPRRTALVALGLFLPLFAAVLWWAFAVRVVPPAAEMYGNTPEGRLFARAALLSAALASGGPAVVAALLIANRKRLRAAMKQTQGRWIAAGLLALLTPIWNFDAVPVIAGFSLFAGVGVILVPVLTLVWYPVSALVISGVKNRALRAMVFALCWWSSYGWCLLLLGWRYPGY